MRIVCVCAVGRGGSAGPPRGAHPASHAIDETEERGVDIGDRFRRAAECTLRADRAPPPARLHGPRIPVVREGVKLPAGRAAEA